MRDHVDVRIGTWAADHDGITTAAEAIALGVTPEQVHKRVVSGRLLVIHEGVYRVAGAPDTWRGRLRAATLAGGDDAYASHHAFARLNHLRGTYQTRPEITVVGARLPSLDGVRV